MHSTHFAPSSNLRRHTKFTSLISRRRHSRSQSPLFEISPNFTNPRKSTRLRKPSSRTSCLFSTKCNWHSGCIEIGRSRRRRDATVRWVEVHLVESATDLDGNPARPRSGHLRRKAPERQSLVDRNCRLAHSVDFRFNPAPTLDGLGNPWSGSPLPCLRPGAMWPLEFRLGWKSARLQRRVCQDDRVWVPGGNDRPSGCRFL